MDENYQCLKEEARKTKQALENALNEKETQKAKLVSTYKLFSKTEDELKSIFLEIESDRKNTGLPVDEEYNNSYWKWKDADEANEKAQIALKKYDENYHADIPDVMIELKEVKSQNEEMKSQNEEMQRQNEELRKELQEVKNEMQEMKAMLPQMMMQQNEEMMKILNMLSFHYDEEKERLYQNAQPFTGNRVFTFPNGDMFEGDFQNGKPHQGKMTFANGDMFEGDFQNGKPHQGKMTFANGDMFEGDFQNGKPQGKGKMTFANGDMFEGDFQNGKPHQGKGKMTFANGDMFEGDFQNGKPQGKGKMTFANGDMFEGGFQNGKPHQGKMTSKSNGKGRMVLANGNQIECVDFSHDFSNITPAFNGQKKEVDILFLEPVEARYITFKPKSWNNDPYLRCEVYVDNVLQNTPLNQRSCSSYLYGYTIDSTMNASSGWLHKSPHNSNEWLKLDLQQVKTITGIRVGTPQNAADYYVSNLALEFGN